MCNSLCRILFSRKQSHTIWNGMEKKKVLCRFQRPACVLQSAESACNLPCFPRRLKLQEKWFSTHQTHCCSGRRCYWECLGSAYPATAHTSSLKRGDFLWPDKLLWDVTPEVKAYGSSADQWLFCLRYRVEVTRHFAAVISTCKVKMMEELQTSSRKKKRVTTRTCVRFPTKTNCL